MAEQDEPMTTVKRIVAYRQESSKSLGLLLLGTVALIGVIGLLLFTQLTTRPDPLIFELNAKEQIIDPVPLDQEGISRAALLNWVNNLLITAFSYNYSNIDKQFSKIADYMSETAMESYRNLLRTDEDLASVEEMQYVVAVVPKTAPEIVVSRSFRGRHAWQIRVPIQLTFSNALRKSTQQAEIEFLVLRVPETESPLGIKVAGFTFKVIRRANIQRPVRTRI